VFIVKSSGAGASNLMGTLLVLDLGVAAVVVFRGIMRHKTMAVLWDALYVV